MYKSVMILSTITSFHFFSKNILPPSTIGIDFSPPILDVLGY